MAKSKVGAVGGESPTNGGAEAISFSEPYSVRVKIRGTADMLFHRYNCEAVKGKGEAPKGSKAKKTDDTESYVYRNEDGEICLPGEYLRQSIIHASKFKQDPRSPRKSAMDLFKAGVLCSTMLASLGVKEWHYDHMAPVGVQKARVTRVRPAIRAGWEAEFVIEILTPEYIGPDLLQEVIVQAGRLIGVADFRPTYGRFAVSAFEVLRADNKLAA